MAVLRIVPNLISPDPARAREFYGTVIGLEAVMDLGWIVTFGSDAAAKPQITSRGVSGVSMSGIHSAKSSTFLRTAGAGESSGELTRIRLKTHRLQRLSALLLRKCAKFCEALRTRAHGRKKAS
jgi:hypothetical protein